MTQDDRFFTSREQPEAAGLSATLQHISGWPVLSITESPQTLELKLVNRTPHPVTAGPATLRLLFRPGVLTAVNKLTLAPQSEAHWVLAVEDTKPEEEVSILLAGVEQFTLAPGQSCAIRLDGVSAAPEGGSRATRVEVAYSDFFHDGGSEVAGARLIHMPVLRRHAPVGRPIKEIRTGSVSVSGPFTAGFKEGGDILNDGETPNRLVLRIANTSNFAVAWSHLGDEASRLYLSFRHGTKGAEWGLLSSDGDHLGIESALEYKASEDHEIAHQGWQTDNHTLRRTNPGALAPGDFVEIVLEVHSKAWTGQTQVMLAYENLPQHDDGDLVLIAGVGGIADRPDKIEIVKPVNIAADLTLTGEARFAGGLSTDRPFIDVTAETFELGGSASSYYPVVIANMAQEDGPLRFEVFRADANADRKGRGAFMAEVLCYGAKGKAMPFWDLKVRQHGSQFIGGFEQVGSPSKASLGSKSRGGISGRLEALLQAQIAAVRSRSGAGTTNLQVMWLKGGTTYAWRSSGPASLVNKDSFGDPKKVSLVGRSFAVKSTPDRGFRASSITMSRTGDEPALTPVPSGAIIMWSGDAKNIPFGWVLCDGRQGTPDLTDRFIMGRGPNRQQNDLKGDGDKHRHSIHIPRKTTSKAGRHNHDFPSGWYKRDLSKPNFLNPGAYSAIDTAGADIENQSTGFTPAHSHTVNIGNVNSKYQGVLRPKWYALCFIMKLGTPHTD